MIELLIRCAGLVGLLYGLLLLYVALRVRLSWRIGLFGMGFVVVGISLMLTALWQIAAIAGIAGGILDLTLNTERRVHEAQAQGMEALAQRYHQTGETIWSARMRQAADTLRRRHNLKPPNKDNQR